MRNRKKVRAGLTLRTDGDTPYLLDGLVGGTAMLKHLWMLAAAIFTVSGQVSTGQDNLDRVEENLSLKSRNGGPVCCNKLLGPYES